MAYGLGRDTFNQGQAGSFGLSIEEDVQPPMTAKGPGGVAVVIETYETSHNDMHLKANKEIASALCATDKKDPPIVFSFDCRNMMTNEEMSGTLQAKNESYSLNFINPVCISTMVRRLTPLECCRLQGFPDDWCKDLEIAEPTEVDLAFWREAFNTYCDLNGLKRKTDRQITDWLKKHHGDSAEYKMWGNGIALPCAVFIMSGIAGVLREEEHGDKKPV